MRIHHGVPSTTARDRLLVGDPVISRVLGRLRNDHLLRNAFLLMVHTAIGSVFGLVFWIVASHRQTPVELGLASALVSLLPLAATIGGLGMDSAVFRHYSESPDRWGLIVRGLVLASTGSAVIGFGVGFLRHSGASFATTVLTTLAAAMLGANGITSSVIIASRRTGLLLFESLASSVVKLAAILVFPADSEGLVAAVAAGICVSGVVSMLVTFLVLRPERSRSTERESVTGYAASNWLAASFSLVPFAVLPSIVVWRAGPGPAALVAVAALVSPLLRLIPTMFTRSFFAEVAADPSKLVPLLRRTYRFSLGATALAATALAVLAPYVLTLFGEDYREGSTVLVRYLALGTTIAVANYLADAVLNLRRDHKAFLFTNVSGMTFLLALLVFASVHGANGIGMAWVVGETIYATISWTTVYLRHGRHGFLRNS